MQLPANACLGSLLFLNIPFPRFWPKKKGNLDAEVLSPRLRRTRFRSKSLAFELGQYVQLQPVAPASHTSGKGKISLGETPRRSKPIRAPCHALLAALHHTFHDVVWQLHCWVILSQLQCTQTQTQAHQSYQGLSCLSIIYSPGIPPPTFKCFEISFPQKALPIRKNHRSHNLDALKSLRSDWADHPIYWDQMVK